MIEKPDTLHGQTLGEWMDTLPIRHMMKVSVQEAMRTAPQWLAYSKFAEDPLTRKIIFLRNFEGDDWLKKAIQAMAEEIYAEVRNLKRFDIWWTMIPEVDPRTKRAGCMLMIRPVEEETKH